MRVLRGAAFPFICICAFSTAAHAAPPRFTHVEVMPFTTGPDAWSVNDLNDSGQLVGVSSAAGVLGGAIAWPDGPTNPAIALTKNSGQANALAINSSGAIAGTVGEALPALFTLTIDGPEATLLPTFGGCCGGAHDVNDAGVVVGGARFAGSQTHAAMWVDGTISELGTLPNGNSSAARSINDDGVVVGNADDGERNRAVIFGEDEITVLPDQGGLLNVPEAINNSNVIVGWLYRSADKMDPIPVRWIDEELAPLPVVDGAVGEANDVNDAGDIVGRMRIFVDEGRYRFGMLWRDGVAHRLNDLVVDLPADQTLTRAVAINDEGQVLADKLDETGVAFTYVVLSPIAPGDVDFDDTVNVSDLLALLSAWGPCTDGCPADLNRDDVVNVQDLLIVLANWGEPAARRTGRYETD